jgi:hypothetical protein
MASSATATFASVNQSITLSAQVSTNSGVVNEGSVTFTVYSDAAETAPVGSPVTSGTVSNGSASASYTLPGGSPVGTYYIAAVYNPGPDFTGSSDTSETLTVALPSIPTAYILNPTASAAVNASGNATVKLPGGLYVDSSSSSAIKASGNAQVNVGGTVQVVGGVSTSGNAAVTKTGTPGSTTDPLASLPLPSVTGLADYGAVSVSGHNSTTLSPGIYTSIQVSGNASATLSAGTYIIEGGGLNVSGNASLTGSGVLIFNAGSNYNGTTDGGSYGGIQLGGNGTIKLSGPTSGPYTGVVIFQSRTNTRPLSLSGNGAAGITSAIYAPAASAGLSGNAAIKGSLIVSTLTVSGNAGAFQLADGSTSGYDASTCNWISDGILTVAVEDDAGNGIDPNELARLGDAMTYLNQALGAFGVDLTWAAPGAAADVTVHFASSTPYGGASAGVLGFTTAGDDVYLVTTGWDFYTGSDPGGIGSGQYDFQTLAEHELAHTVGLGESSDPQSVMYEYLSAGTVRRAFTDSNLSLINTDADRFMKAEVPSGQARQIAVAVAPIGQFSTDLVGLPSGASNAAVLEPSVAVTLLTVTSGPAGGLPVPAPLPSSSSGSNNSGSGGTGKVVVVAGPDQAAAQASTHTRATPVGAADEPDRLSDAALALFFAAPQHGEPSSSAAALGLEGTSIERGDESGEEFGGTAEVVGAAAIAAGLFGASWAGRNRQASNRQQRWWLCRSS